MLSIAFYCYFTTFSPVLDNSKHQRDGIETIQVFMDKFKQDWHQTIRETWMNSHFRQEMALSVWVNTNWFVDPFLEPLTQPPLTQTKSFTKTPLPRFPHREVPMLTIECAKYDKSGPKIMGVCVQNHLLNYNTKWFIFWAFFTNLTQHHQLYISIYLCNTPVQPNDLLIPQLTKDQCRPHLRDLPRRQHQWHHPAQVRHRERRLANLQCLALGGWNSSHLWMTWILK